MHATIIVPSQSPCPSISGTIEPASIASTRRTTSCVFIGGSGRQNFLTIRIDISGVSVKIGPGWTCHQAMYQLRCQWLFRFLAFYSNPSNMPIVFPCISNETLMYPYTACDVISMGFWLKYCLLNLIELANLQIITRPTDILLWMHNLLHHEERWIADRTVLPYHQVTGVLLYGKWKRLVSDHIRSWSSFLI